MYILSMVHLVKLSFRKGGAIVWIVYITTNTKEYLSSIMGITKNKIMVI